MISNAHEKRNRAERRNLAIDEVGPGDVLVLENRQGLLRVFRLMLDVFIESGGQAQIAQVPIKRGLILLRSFSDPRHHHVAAIPGIAGRNKPPRSTGWLL